MNLDEILVDVCEAGKLFFWCVTRHFDGYPMAHGYCDTLEEAEEKMWALGTILARGRKINDCTQYTRAARKRNPKEKGCWTARAARHAVWVKDCTRPTGEFLYSEFESEAMSYGIQTAKHEIVKKTKTKVYVHVDRWRVVALDRRRLESLGEARSRKAGRTYYTQPYEVRQAVQMAEHQRWFEELVAKL